MVVRARDWLVTLHLHPGSRRKKKERGGEARKPQVLHQWWNFPTRFQPLKALQASQRAPRVQTCEHVGTFCFQSTAGQQHEGPLKRNTSFHSYWEYFKCTDDVWMCVCTMKWLLQSSKWVQPLLYIQVTVSVCAFANVWYDVFICYLSKALRLLLNLNYCEQGSCISEVLEIYGGAHSSLNL